MTTDLTINVTSKMQGGQIYFDTKFNRSLDSVEQAQIKNFTVNLSRARNRYYTLDKLSDHNGTGATWNGIGVHDSKSQYKYQERVKNDIATQWEAFKKAVVKAKTPVSTIPANSGYSTFFSANGN